MLKDGGLQIDEVGWIQGVGFVVGEVAVQVEVERDDRQGQRRESRASAENGRNGMSGHPISRIDNDAQLSDRGEVDQFTQEPGVGVEEVLADDFAGRCRGGALPGEEFRGPRPDRDKPGVLTDRLSAGSGQLDPVVLRRVVAGGEHRPGDPQLPTREVEAVSARQPDVDRVEPARADASGEGVGKAGGGIAHVAPDRDPGRTFGFGDDFGERDA